MERLGCNCLSLHLFGRFFIAPLMWNIGMTMMDKEVQMATSRWAPLTLGGGAMFHLSFGAILGATSFNRHKEKSEQDKS